jgi:hypothetical protein
MIFWALCHALQVLRRFFALTQSIELPAVATSARLANHRLLQAAAFMSADSKLNTCAQTDTHTQTLARRHTNKRHTKKHLSKFCLFLGLWLVLQGFGRSGVYDFSVYDL